MIYFVRIPGMFSCNVNFKDISRIVKFLNTLNDDNFDKSVPAVVPSGLQVTGL